MKKIFCLLLVLIMAFSLLVSCNQNGNDDPDKDPETEDGGKDKDDKDDKDDEDEEWWDDISYDETNLIFQMTHCSNQDELSSGCERYLAGESDDNGEIDKLVDMRN